MALLNDLFNPPPQRGLGIAPDLPGILAEQKRNFLGLSGPTLVSLGAGIASGDDWGEGIGRGLQMANQTRQGEQAREAQIEPMRMSYKALVEGGETPQSALLRTFNPGAAAALDERKKISDWQKMILGDPSTGGPGAEAFGVSDGAAPAAPGGTLAKFRMAETGGDDSAVNPLSTAASRYQILAPTWEGVMQNYPELGLTEADRMDPEKQEVAMGVLMPEYQTALSANKIPVNDTTLYSTHVLGAGDMPKVLLSDATTPMVDLVSANVIKSNPIFADMTSGDFVNWAQSKVGGGAPAPTPAAAPVAAPGAMASPGNLIASLSPQQKTLLAAAGPTRGPALLAGFLQDAQTRAAKQAETAQKTAGMTTLLQDLYPDMAADQAQAIIQAGAGDKYVAQALQQDPGLIREYKFAVENDGFPGTLVDYAQAKKGEGFEFVGPDGTTVRFGGGSGSGNGLTKPTQGLLEKDQFNTSKLAGRVADIRASFQPEYLTLPERFKNWGRSAVAKNLGEEALPEGERAALTDFVTFKATAINNINRVLNELSGAAVSPAEGTRIRAALPDPGDGIFDGDDPVTFRAKMDRVLNDAEKALARLDYYRSTGKLPTSIDEIPLADIENFGGNWFVKDGGAFNPIPRSPEPEPDAGAPPLVPGQTPMQAAPAQPVLGAAPSLTAPAVIEYDKTGKRAN